MTDDKAAEALLKAEQRLFAKWHKINRYADRENASRGWMGRAEIPTQLKLLARIAELEAQVVSARDDALDEAMLKVKSLGNYYNVNVKINAFMACVLDLLRALKSTARENK